MLIAALGGEPLEFVVDGKVVATALTGGDGRAFFTYTPKAQGLSTSPRPHWQQPTSRPGRRPGQSGGVGEAAAHPRDRIVVTDRGTSPSRVPPIGIALESERKPMAEVADELGKLTQFYYRVIYVVTLPVGGDGFQKSAEAREWLKRHKLPTGYVMALPADPKP